MGEQSERVDAQELGRVGQEREHSARVAPTSYCSRPRESAKKGGPRVGSWKASGEGKIVEVDVR